MAENNYLNCFLISITKKHDRSKKNTTSSTVTFADFNNYFNANGDQSEDSIFAKIASEYVKTFNGQFKKSQNNKRAITAKTEYIKYSVKNRTIYGFVEGGITDASFENYSRSDNKKTKGKTDKDDVLSQPYFFKIYLPFKSNIGVVLLQSNDSVYRGIISAFFDHLAEFFLSRDFILTKNAITPESVSEAYYSKTHINAIEVIQMKQMSDETSKGTQKTVTVKHTLNNFRMSRDGLMKYVLDKKITNELRDLISLEENSTIDKINIKVTDGKTERVCTVEQTGFILRILITPDIKIEKSADSINNLSKFAMEYLNMIITEKNIS